MGECADMLLDGTLDCITGEYIGEPCGYPLRDKSGRNNDPSIRRLAMTFTVWAAAMDSEAQNSVMRLEFSSR